MQITTRQLADTVVLAPSGRIDHQSAADLEAALTPWLAHTAQSAGGLVLDFAAVDYISSVGLRVVMIAAKAMKARQAPLAVAALQSVVAEIFAISRFDRILTIKPSVDEALGFCATAASGRGRPDNATGDL